MNLVVLLTSLVSMAHALDAGSYAAVYKNAHCAKQGDEIKSLHVYDAIYNIAEDVNLGSQYSINFADADLEALSWGKCAGEDTTSNKNREIVIIVNGVEEPDKLFEKHKPVFNVELVNSNAVSTFTDFVQGIGSQLKGKRLSEEITIVTESKVDKLKSIWSQYFEDSETSRVGKIWNDLKSSLSSEESVLSIGKRSINHIQDETFINEMTQLDYFFKQDIDGQVIVTLDSPSQVYKKTGGSQTYETCVSILSHLINERFDGNTNFIVVALPLNAAIDSVKNAKSSLQRRDNGASTFGLSSVGCFKSQKACLDFTDSCSSHGLCSDINGCWRCVCSATKNNKQTTYWTGSSCEKVDYSSQFNLLFWTSLILIVSFVAGVKLLYKAGNEEMPGVLVAATVQTKKSN